MKFYSAALMRSFRTLLARNVSTRRDHFSFLQRLADFCKNGLHQVGGFVSGQANLFVDGLAQVSAGNRLISHVAPQKDQREFTLSIHNKAVNTKR
jgi:hypothetical protein